jgi:putative ABC transport system permease protein
MLMGSATCSNWLRSADNDKIDARTQHGRPLKYLPLVWNGLWRRPARTIFTLLSIAVAYVLFGILSGIDAGFAHTLEVSRMDRLFTDSRFGPPLPLSYADQISSVPGVIVVAPRSGLFGYFQDPKNFVYVLCADRRFFSLRPEITISAQQLETLLQTRTGAAVSAEQARKYGWKIGDKVPIQTQTAQADGNQVWTFDIVAIVDDLNRPGGGGWFIANYSYLDEGRVTEKGTITRFLVRIRDPERGGQIGRQIDKLFANSTVATRTSSERSGAQSYMQYFGDVNFLTTAVLGAVFFMLLFISGNTMLQSIRERIPEFAVLKALGFSDNRVMSLVVAESVLLCLLAAAAGLLVSKLVIPIARGPLSDFFLLLQMPWTAMLRGFVLALIVALLSCLLPALRVRQLNVVEGLVKRQ